MICLSFDTDHIDQERMTEFLRMARIPGSATFFCTQRYTGIDPSHELGPHAVLEAVGDWKSALDSAREMFPEARGFRAHGCLYSHGLALELGNRGYAYISAHDQFGLRGIVPQREAWGVWQLPIYYTDTLDISHQRHWADSDHTPFDAALLEAAVAGEGLYVFAFHPIHMLLNTTSPEEYLARRDPFVAGEPLEQIRCDGYGVASYYEDLVKLMDENELSSSTLDQAVERPSEFSAAAT